MTIAAGLVCADGIVITADQEHTLADSKFYKTKVHVDDKNNLIVTGCDDSDFIKVGFDRLADKVRINLPSDRQAARAFVELHTSGLSKNCQLIVALRCANGELALLKMTTTGNGVSLEPSRAVVGIGVPIFEYWAKFLLAESDERPALSLETASHFLVFMLREAKGSHIGCGGDTDLWKMPNQPGILQSGHAKFTEDGVLAGFPSTTLDAIFSAMDLTKNDEDYATKVDGLKIKIGKLRNFLQGKIQSSGKSVLHTAVSADVRSVLPKRQFE